MAGSAPYARKRPEIPRRLIETTDSPKTIPPLKATFNAGSNPVKEAFAVLTFERTEMYIATYPAKLEARAPTMNATAVWGPRSPLVGSLSTTAKIAAKTTTMTLIVRYWRLRYASAPCRIASAISRIRGLPASLAIIHLTNSPATRSDTRETPIMNSRRTNPFLFPSSQPVGIFCRPVRLDYKAVSNKRVVK